jgi:hypothetical protein
MSCWHYTYGKFKGRFIGGEKWKNPRLEISRITGNVLALVGATHLLTSIVPTRHLQYMYYMMIHCI